jgi:ribosomal protein S18 acetylase RimI-like enzyme
MTYRQAIKSDAPAIAALHALSWQRTYRGDFPDHYLDHEAPAERREVWTARFSDTTTPMQVNVAETEEGLTGFCCVFPHHSPADGHLLDNLHVHPDHHGRGVGKRLMQRAAERLLEAKYGGKIFLWVLTTNTASIGFYEHLGGRTGRTETHHFPEGAAPPALLMSWPVAEMADWNFPPE